jgi:hypothetical protein
MQREYSSANPIASFKDSDGKTSAGKLNRGGDASRTGTNYDHVGIFRHKVKESQ